MSAQKSINNRKLIKEVFRNLPIIKGLSENNINTLIKDFSIVRIKKGDTIFHQLDESADLYIVIEGGATASLLNDEGQELILSRFAKGDFFGEMGLLDGRPRSATITASEDSVLGVLKREKFIRAIKKDPVLSIDLLSALAERLRKTDEMLESLAFLDVGQRITKLFLQIARTAGEKETEGFFRIKKITHREIAALTGSSREAVSKALKALAFKNVIREKEGYFMVSKSGISG